MLPGFMRRLLRKHDTITTREDEKPPSDGESSFFVQELAAGNTEALGVLLTRYQDVMNGAALRLTRGYRMSGIFVEADDALSGTLVRMLADSRDGRLSSMQNTSEFWKEFLDLLREELSALDNQSRALKRGGPGRAPRTITLEGTIDELPSMIRRLGAEILDEMIDHAPGPEDLALATLTVEALIKHLNSPLMTRIVSMRLDQYSIEEISHEVGVAIRTVERRLSDVRDTYLEHVGRLVWA